MKKLIQDNGGLDDHAILLYTNEFEHGWLVALELDGDEWAMWTKPMTRPEAASLARKCGRQLDLKVYEQDERPRRTRKPARREEER